MEVVYHEKENGQCPTIEFLQSLPEKARAKVMGHLTALGLTQDGRLYESGLRKGTKEDTSMIRHKDYLKKQMKSPRFREAYERELFIVRVSERIARLREKKGLTQEALAKRLGVKASMVSRIEAGRQNLTLDSLHRIAQALSTRLRVEIGAA